VAVAAGLLLYGVSIIVRGHMLSTRLRALLERERAQMADLAERGSELERINERLVEDSRHDPHTGLRNRRALGYDLPRLEGAHRERGDSFAVAVLDVDHFKAYNDQLGHLAGDHALRAVAGIVREHLRDGDLAYRFGGEELLVLLPSTRLTEAVNAAERLRTAIEAAALPHPGGIDGILTISIGVASEVGSTSTLLAQADAALYQAKGSGRNRVVAATGVTTHAVTRDRRSRNDEAVPRQLRSMLQVSRAAASGRGVMPVLTVLAEALRRELSFELVCVNLLRPEHDDYEAVVVLGDQASQDALFGVTSPADEFRTLMTSEYEREGAYWLPEGTDLGDIYVYDP
jgi:diguanylate cyclase (GGDEF)-like protein